MAEGIKWSQRESAPVLTGDDESLIWRGASNYRFSMTTLATFLDGALSYEPAGTVAAHNVDPTAHNGIDILTGKGELLTHDGANTYIKQAPGTDGFLVSYDSAQATGLASVDPATLGAPLDVAKDGGVVVSDAGQLNFLDEGDTTIAIVDAGAGVADITISSSGGGGGDMTKAVYDTDDNGVVDGSENVVRIGTNSTGSTITRGTFVQAAVGGSIAPAQPSSGQWAIGCAQEDIPAGQSGPIILDGLVENVNTAVGGGSTNDAIYLAADGGWTITKPIDAEYQQLGRLWSIDAVTGSFVTNPQDTEVPEVEGALGTLYLNEAATPLTHAVDNGTTWNEIIPGAGETTVAQLVNMSAGANAGRLKIDYSGSSGPTPGAGEAGGVVDLSISLQMTTTSQVVEVAPAVNGVVVASDLAQYASIGGQQTVGTTIPASIGIPISLLSDQDELSIVTRGTVADVDIHSMTLSFLKSEGGSGGGGSGGTNDHTQLSNRNVSDQHIIGSITGLQAALDAKADQTALDAHTGAVTGAHAASAISVTPTGDLVATDGQAAFAELDGDITAVNSSLTSHIGSGGAAHADATTSVDGFMSAADKTKLDGIPADATASPTTTQGDLIRRGASADERLPVGPEGQILKVVSGVPAWAPDTGGGGVNNPPSVDGDLWTYNSGNQQRLPVGLEGQVLKVTSGLPTWSADLVGAGTLTTVRKNSGADVSTGRARLNFIEGANVLLDIQDDGAGDEVDITITSTASGGGGGDMLSPASMTVGELYEAGDTGGVQTVASGILTANVPTMASAAAGAGNVIQSAGADKTQSDSGVAVTALARTDQATTFTDIVTVHAPGNSGFIFHSDTAAVAARFLPGLGTVGQRDYDIAVVDGDFSILAIEDDIGTNPSNRFSISWTGDVSIPVNNFDVLNGESKQEGITLRRPVASVRTGANIRLSSARGVGELVDITEAGNFDLQPPLNSEARDSEWTILIRNNVTVNTPIGGADGDWDIVIGTDPGGANRIAYAIQMADATSILSWVQTS